MNTNNNWKDYECIKTGNGEKLERWNNIILIRPDPQIIWNTQRKSPRDTHFTFYVKEGFFTTLIISLPSSAPL